MGQLQLKMDSFYWKAKAKAQVLRNKVESFLHDEDGDTNFLSIIIILAIVLLLAIVFIAFKDAIVGMVNQAWTDFSTKFSGQKEVTPTPPV